MLKIGRLGRGEGGCLVNLDNPGLRGWSENQGFWWTFFMDGPWMDGLTMNFSSKFKMCVCRFITYSTL